MASAIKGITIQIEGNTSGLVKSLQSVESQIKKDDAALKNLEKALELDPKNVDLLAAKEAVLAEKTELTAQKLEILQQVQSDALTDLPEDAQLTTSQMAELQAEIASTSMQLEDLEDGAGDAGDDIEETGDKAEDSGKAMETFGEAAEAAGEMAVAAFEAVVAAAAAVTTAIVAAGTAIGSAMVTATMDTASLADELLTMSSTTGLSTDTLQELNYASELLDVSTDTVTGSMTKLLKTMSSAADGSSSAMEKFESLGISIYDAEGNIRSTEDVFWEAIDTLGQFESETERDMASMELFGKSARELNPLIEAGSDTFRELADEAREVGYVMDGETLDAFGALDDNMQRMSNTAQAVEQSFGQVLLPLLTDASGDLVDLMGDFSGALAGAGGDIDAIGGIIEQFAPQAVALVEKYIPKILTVFEQVFGALLPVVVKVAPQIISLAGELVVMLANSISDNSEEFISAFESLFESVVNSAITLLPVIIPLAIQLIETLVNALLEPGNLELLISGALGMVTTLVETLTDESNLTSLILAATTIITSLLNGLSEALPILIPAALNAILTIVDTLLESGSLEQILSAALSLINTLAIGLIQYLPELISRLPEIIIGIVEFLTGDALPDIIEAGFTLITAIVGKLPEIIVAIVNALIELVAGMIDYITGDGQADLMKNFEAVFQGIADGAMTWGSDVIDMFIDGIMSMWESLKSTLNSVADLVKAILGFSVPEEGPLHEWAFNNPGEDMLELYAKGIHDGMSDVKNALADTANLISNDVGNFDLATQNEVHHTVDYSGGLSRIEHAITSSAAVASASEASTIVIPVYIGGQLIDTVVMDSIDRVTYLNGGH